MPKKVLCTFEPLKIDTNPFYLYFCLINRMSLLHFKFVNVFEKSFKQTYHIFESIPQQVITNV